MSMSGRREIHFCGKKTVVFNLLPILNYDNTHVHPENAFSVA